MNPIAELPIARFARLQCALRLDRLAYEARQTIRRSEAEDVHDLRVAIRKLLAALKVFRVFLPEKGRKQLAARLRETIRKAAPVRDRDIADELLAEAGLDQSGPCRERLRRERAVALKRLITAIKKAAWGDIARRERKALRLDVTRKAHVKPGWLAADAGTNARGILPPLAADFFARGALAAHPEVQVEELHELRLCGKRVRYSLELFGDCYADGLKPLLLEVKLLQDSLGEIQDCEATSGLLQAGGDDEQAEREIARAFLDQRSLELRERFLKDWGERLARGAHTEDWRGELARGSTAA